MTAAIYDPAFGTVRGRRGGGFVGGAQAGYNYQFGMFVAGVETDLQYAAVGNKGASYGTTYYSGDSDGFFGTIRARAGVAFDRALVYGTGGFAYGDIGGNSGYDPVLGYHSGDEINWGWTLGGGVEYAITNNFTAKVEGLYVDLDTKDNYNLGGRVNVDRDAEFGVSARRRELQVQLIAAKTRGRKGPVAAPGLLHDQGSFMPKGGLR